MFGIELLDAGAIAVSIEEAGRIAKRVWVDAGKDLGAAAVAALGQVGAGAAPLGIASATPEAPAVAAAVMAIGKRIPGAPTVAIASGIAGGAAEAWGGVGRGFKDVVFFAVSEHATGGIVREGEPIDGGHRRAASVAWLALNPVEREDYRRIGCLEAEVAAAGIVRRLIWRIKSGDQSSAQKAAGGNLAAITVDHVLAAARQGDGVAISIVRDTAKYLGMAAANLIVITDPQVLAVGGLMATCADLFLEPLRFETMRRLPKSLGDLVTIAPASFKDDAPAVGAARLAALSVR
ncbi:MAG TPA: ROK family protein [Vicinamibacterales bacterium]|nr:ROK family protein [Vicinamibacterales bacterium]